MPWEYLDFNLWAPLLQDFNSSRFWHLLAREYAWMLQKAQFQTDAMKGFSSGSNCSQPHLAATMLQHPYYHTDPHLCCPCYLECDILIHSSRGRSRSTFHVRFHVVSAAVGRAHCSRRVECLPRSSLPLGSSGGHPIGMDGFPKGVPVSIGPFWYM